ncbi:hypothetical protein J2X63_001045 [Agromyces sp. 3263]|uniref:zinc ribbon domain-containing protein n=1 Tax=Agromyces sp. 3263 TaxID=2817750 RepID=UPI0028616FED|nr:zinc ribbon domain-containing protein [Agromyces sp. 3263]MDR6905359.1 hypothetical protein [Agromyces sp. 3263]
MSGIRCAECGAMNDDGDDFCGQCGSYLAWDRGGATDAASQPIDEAAAALREPEAEPEPDPDATPEPASDPEPPAVPEPEPQAETAPEPEPAPDPELAPEPEPEPEPRPDPRLEAMLATPHLAKPAAVVAAPSPEDPVATPPAPAAPAPAVPGPVAPTAPAARKPAAVPQHAPKRAPRPVGETVKPGDIVCWRCGTGNAPGRHFCRHCAAPLGATANRTQPRSQQAAAGTRPKTKRRRIRPAWIVVPAIIVVLGAVAWFARGPIAGFVAAIGDRVVDSSAQNPVALVASSAADGRGAELAHDGFADRSWAPAPTGPADGEYLEASFAQPFRLVAVQVSPGASADQAVFLAEGRPAVLGVTAIDSAGVPHEVDLTLADEPGPQRFELGIDDVTAVRLTLEGAHGATDATHVAVAEVEFLGR